MFVAMEAVTQDTGVWNFLLGLTLDTLHDWAWTIKMTKIRSEWPRIASGQPGSIASKIFGRVHKASRRHYNRDSEDHSPRLEYERSKHRRVDSDHDEMSDRSDRRKKSKRWEYEPSRNSQSPTRTFSGHRDKGGHDSNRSKSHSPSHFEHHHHNSHRSQASEESVTSNKYFAFHPSASPKRNKSSLQSQVKLDQLLARTLIEKWLLSL